MDIYKCMMVENRDSQYVNIFSESKDEEFLTFLWNAMMSVSM